MLFFCFGSLSHPFSQTLLFLFGILLFCLCLGFVFFQFRFFLVNVLLAPSAKSRDSAFAVIKALHIWLVQFWGWALSWGRFPPFGRNNLPLGNVFGHHFDVVQQGRPCHILFVKLGAIGGNLSTLVIILAAPSNLFFQVTQIRLDGNVINVGLQQGKVPHAICHLSRGHFQNDGTQPHHESITTCSAMTIHIDQILVLGLFVNWSEVLPTCCKLKVFGAQKGHGSIRYLLVSQIPTDNCSIHKRLFTALFRIILPLVREVCYLDTLVIIDGRSPASGCPAEKGCGHSVVVPSPFKLSKVGFSKEITGISKDRVSFTVFFKRNEGLWKHQTTGTLPILGRWPRNVSESIFRRRIKTDNGCVCLERVLWD
mmetsp:Transcript_1128/g.2261  ORF Transcript_1128/g.2261 Transcript_1128/m.2261 type:complete len:368 (+) Transcript_1128:953-2056(+)